MKLRGKLIIAGTMQIDGDVVTGVFIETTEAALQCNLPLYREVEVAEVEQKEGK